MILAILIGKVLKPLVRFIALMITSRTILLRGHMISMEMKAKIPLNYLLPMQAALSQLPMAVAVVLLPLLLMVRFWSPRSSCCANSGIAFC